MVMLLLMLDHCNLFNIINQCFTWQIEFDLCYVDLSAFYTYRDTEPIVRHENFRLFACMNPATDVGKKELPLGVRNRYGHCFCVVVNLLGNVAALHGLMLNGVGS